MYRQLQAINQRPEPFEHYTAESLWVDSYRSEQMLAYHLNEAIDVSSRNRAFIDQSSAWIETTFALNKEKSVCDFGCGPGLYTSRFAQTGADVTGVDFSKTSINYAQKFAQDHQLNIHYHCQNYLTFEESRPFDLITMIMCDFCALSPEQRTKLLTLFDRHLKPGGSILLDVYSMTAFDQKKESASYEKNQLNYFWSKKDYFAFLNTFKYEQEKVVLDKYTIIHENDQIDTVYNWLQYFTPETLKPLFTDAGFVVKAVYSDVAGHPYSQSTSEFAIVATK